MTYKGVTAKINNDGTVSEGKRKTLIITPQKLRVGGLYFIRPGHLYRIVEALPDS